MGRGTGKAGYELDFEDTFDGDALDEARWVPHHLPHWTIGQHRFHPGAVVTEEQQNVRLYTPRYGVIEMRAKALDDPRSMVALWMDRLRGRARALGGDLRLRDLRRRRRPATVDYVRGWRPS